MTTTFLTEFLPAFIESPSPSDPDNALVEKLIQEISNREDCGVEINDLKIRCLLAWQTKKLPRYLVNNNGDYKPDNLSGPLWSPAFYRINPSLEHLKEKLTGSTVFDPFAGSGSLVHALLSFNIPRAVALNDYCYIGGKAILEDEGGDEFFYDPAKNRDEYIKLFKKYNDFIVQPDFNKHTTYTAEDVSKGLSFGDGEFDWVFSDPPYGKNLNSFGYNTFLGYLPEILRVSHKGLLLFIPESWLLLLATYENYGVENLTGTLAHKNTTFKTTLAHIYQK